VKQGSNQQWFCKIRATEYSNPIITFIMAQHGRPLKHDPRADDITGLIDSEDFDTAKRLLLEIGIDIADGYGRTALINSIIRGNLSFAAWLLEKGAEVNHKDKAGFTALHFTGQERNVDAALFLLEKGADPNIQDIHGNSPLWTAIFNAKLPNQDQGVVEALLKHGANPDTENRYGKTSRFMYKTFHNQDIPN
jgi:ankyrin repeat protein